MAEEMEKVNEALTVFNIGDRKLELREMKIKKTKDLSEKLYFFHSSLAKYLQDKDGNPLKSTDTVDPAFIAGTNTAILNILNYVFDLQGESQITQEWFEENISFRVLETIIKEAARQSRVDWLIPFFDVLSLPARLMQPPPKIQGEINVPNGNPITS